MKRLSIMLVLFVLMVEGIIPVRAGGGHSYWLAWSPDGNNLVVMDSTDIWLYDPSDFSAEPIVLTPADSTTEFKHAAFSPDSSVLVAGTPTLYRWDLSTSEAQPILNVPTGETLLGLLFSGDGTVLIVQTGTMIRLYDSASYELLTEIEVHSRGRAVLTPEGTAMIAPVCLDIQCVEGALITWDSVTGEELAMIEPGMVILDVAFASPTRLLCLGRSILSQVDLETGEMTAVMEISIPIALAYNPDEDLLVVAEGGLGMAGVVRLFHLQDQTELLHVDTTEPLKTVVFSPTGDLIAFNQGPGVDVWNTTTGEQFAVLMPG